MTPTAQGTVVSPSARTGRRRLYTSLADLHWEGFAAIVSLLVAWQVASPYSSPMFFPSLQKIAASALQMLQSWDAIIATGTTYVRIIVSLVAAFIIALALGLGAAASQRVERFLVPLIELKQGIPAVCWIIFAILWFRDMEVRIAFVIITSALPTFFYQARDSVRGIPRDLFDMVRALRPSFWSLLRILVFPAMLPSLLTSWRINIGNATRVTIMAELLGGITGIGHQLRLSQEMFRMDQVIVWSAVLVGFVVLSNLALSAIERHVLVWRTSEGLSHE